MEKKRRHSPIWHRLLCLLMAFYVINVSIDATDGYVMPNSHGEYREDLSINEIESIGELLLEEILGITNAVPEHDESDEEEDQITKIFMDWSIPGPAVSYRFYLSVGYTPTVHAFFAPNRYFSRPAEVTIPPPKIA